MATVVVTRNYQITIPQDIREELGIKIGERLISKIDEDTIIIKKMKDSPVDKAFGIWKGKIKKSSVDYVRDLRKEWRTRPKYYKR